MKKRTLIFLTIAALALAGFSCGKKKTVNTNTTNTAAEDLNTNTPANDLNASDLNGNTNSNTNASTANHTVTSNGSVTITAPAADATVSSPVTVSGTADGSLVFVRVKNAAGKELFTEQAKVIKGTYTIHLTLALTHTSDGTIEVFQKDSSGSETHLTSVPVKFGTTDKKTESSGDTSVNKAMETTNTNTDTNTNADTSTNDNTNADSTAPSGY